MGLGDGVGGLRRERKGGPIEWAEGEREDRECQQKDEVADDDLDERGSNEESADGAEDNRATLALKPGEA
jgi:hypothetical protein